MEDDRAGPASVWVVIIILLALAAALGGLTVLAGTDDPRVRATRVYEREREQFRNDSIFQATYDSLKRAGRR